MGVFRLATRDAYIENIGVLNVNITGHTWVGGLAGQNSGTVSDCYSTGSVTETPRPFTSKLSFTLLAKKGHCSLNVPHIPGA